MSAELPGNSADITRATTSTICIGEDFAGKVVFPIRPLDRARASRFSSRRKVPGAVTGIAGLTAIL
jgi:hypothetical protein